MALPLQASAPALVLSPEGALTSGETLTRFVHAAHRSMHDRHHALVVNLARVTTLDTEGAGALAEVIASARALGVEVRLAAPTDAVRTALARAVPGQSLPVYDTVAQAARRTSRRDAQLALLTLGLGAALVAFGIWWPGYQLTGGRGPGAPPADALALAVTEVLDLVAAALIGFTVTAVHRRLQPHDTRNDSMRQAQVLLCVSGAMMMLIIGDSLARAFGIVGAAGIIRFRTPVEDPREVTILFILMGLGMACGIGALPLAGLGMIFLCAVLLVISRGNPFTRGPRLVFELTAEGARFPSAQVAATFARHGVAARPVEIIPADPARVRYEIAAAAAAAAGDLETALRVGRGHGLAALNWLQETG